MKFLDAKLLSVACATEEAMRNIVLSKINFSVAPDFRDIFSGRFDKERGHGVPPFRRDERDFISELNLPSELACQRAGGKFNGDPK